MINDNYEMRLPSNQNMIDIFKGSWSSKFPDSWGLVNDGDARLFEDDRIKWYIEKLSNLQDKYRFRHILELGPLEGGHTFMLTSEGYYVKAIEANQKAFMKCLIAKEIVNRGGKFVLGDFVEYLRNSTEKFDSILACGVLYHQQNPVELIKLISEHTNRVFIWTHYTDLTDGFYDYEGVHYDYRDNYYGKMTDSFCGGLHEYGRWLTLDSIDRALLKYGFENWEHNFHDKSHPNGSAIAIMAWK